MKEHNENASFQEKQMPESWSPASDQGRDWEVLASLMKESDNPEMPPPSLFEATQMEIRRQLLHEGLLNKATLSADGKDLGFMDWLKVVFLGGRSGGQLLRFSLVAAVSCYAGVQFSGQEAPESTPYVDSVTEKNGDKPTPDPGSSPITVAEGTRPTPVPSKPSVAMRIEKNPESGWNSTASPDQEWVFNNSSTRQLTVSNRPAGSSTTSETALVSQALDQLQYLKFYSAINQEDQYLTQLRQLEHLLTAMAQESGPAPLGVQTTAMEQYQLAEHAQRAQRYHDAEKMYLEVVRRVPGSPLAFLAEFQAGRIAYQEIGDYDLARRSFTSCLEDYPSVAIPADHQRYLKGWVGILNEGIDDQWMSLEQWQKAEGASSSQQAVVFLLAVVRDSPSEHLVAMASEKLKSLMISDAFDRRLNHKAVCDVLKTRIEMMRDEEQKAPSQFNLAEILAKRSQNPAQAALAYQKVLQLKASGKLHQIAQSRLQVMMNQRITGMIGPEN
jgi:tetratricopeptide (TPR) repeat protein